jgi:pimeloyl-ACP methyl ester carboxylesterase
MLAYAEYGDPAGRPVLYFHGFPGSRLEAAPADRAARELGVRLVAPDRPGYGGSGFEPGRRIGDWPHDVARLAEALGIGSFAALGVSGGCPYLCACALRLRERLTGVGILCGLGPLDRPGATDAMPRFNRLCLLAAGSAPWTATPLARLVAVALRVAPERALDHLARRLPAADHEFLSDPALRRQLSASYREAFRAGARGAAWDLRLYARPWEFPLREITMPVHLWHGERDTIVPPSIARRLAGALPDARSRYFPDEGHFSLAFHRMRAMLQLLAGA